jgi:dTDP-4-dehydrorhamnose reductase
MVVLVTGAGGQLGQSMQFIAKNYPEISFHFYTSRNLNITDKGAIDAAFQNIRPDYCVNAAAYTAVDKAETEPEKAHAINVTGVRHLAETCKDFNTILIHISTDFVFDGHKKSPYTEIDPTNPQGVYAQTKLAGEQALQESYDRYFILRTSWVYSQFGNNFMKTMLRLSLERTELNVVNDQIGTPTHAVDLAGAIVKIIGSDSKLYGIYNFSNEGIASWYDFAKKIFEINNVVITLKPIPTSAFPTPAKRPAYSVLDKSKIRSIFGITINDWKTSLERN